MCLDEWWVWWAQAWNQCPGTLAETTLLHNLSLGHLCSLRPGEKRPYQKLGFVGLLWVGAPLWQGLLTSAWESLRKTQRSDLLAPIRKIGAHQGNLGQEGKGPAPECHGGSIEAGQASESTEESKMQYWVPIQKRQKNRCSFRRQTIQ